jgi:hypothetical protein
MQLIGCENEGAIMDSTCQEHSFGRNLMTCIFGMRKSGKHSEHPETVGTLAL